MGTKGQPQGAWLKNGNRVCDLQLLPRCGAKAKSRNLEPCNQPAMSNGRCRFHGGKGSGPPLGNQNAFRHGMHTSEMKEQKKQLSKLLKEAKEMMGRL